ncbi:MAG TPA: DNA cytosine methyltransferase [Verrucomicrobiae bacterium]|nr:DNA cytosine methyltransferase [Verrucomicrobiae bacterium]
MGTRVAASVALGQMHVPRAAAAPPGLPAVDLFCGAGGLSLGLSASGWQVVAAVDRDRDALDTYRGHHPGTAVTDGDIVGMTFRPLRGTVALVAGGAPCQPFSSGGLRLAAADDRDLLPAFFRVVAEVRPVAFLLENVPGLVTGTRRAYLDRQLVRFRGLLARDDLGARYRLTMAVLNAADYGVPQNRRRLFLVGLQSKQPFEFPDPTHGPGRAAAHVGAGSCVDPVRPVGTPNPSIVTYARNPDLRPSPYDGHVYNGGGRPIDLARTSHTILASAGGNKTHWLDALGTVPAYHAHLRSGGAPRAGTVPGARRLTVEESALLQTFSVEVRFAGRRSSRYTQIGNAVPPRLAAVIGEAVRAQLPD